MALKRKRRASSDPKGLAPGELLKRFMIPSSSATPWSWVGSEATTPDEITAEHKRAVYGFSSKSGLPCCKNIYASRPQTDISPLVDEQGDVIIISDDDENPQCSKKACKNNPRCLNYLGQDVWEDEEKAQALFDKSAESKEDPSLLSRDPDIPVGLRNLGATCYANSSLQVWFRDIAFRNGVYRCQVPEGSEKEFKDFPIFNLQVTFAALQEGRQSVYNPTKLVESLHLRTSEQQDAQEFSKLFMSHLDAEFKKQSDPVVRNLIASQFQGSQVYGTVCHTCNYTSERSSDFLEIEVNIKANSRLEDRIKIALEPEVLTQDNQYLCPQCNSLQDATRYTELRQLPPVLHFSLLRFVYDLSTMERKKSKHVITFPAVLDMGQFLGKQGDGVPNDNAQNIYELRGILLHKGSSAYHGHYEAQVYDTQLGSWFQFNDETVTKITLFGDKARVNKTSADTTQKKSSRKRRRIVESDDDEPVLIPAPERVEHTISSKDAYMLVYMRKDTMTGSPNAEILSPKPPPLALRVVEQMNEDHEKSCEEHEKRLADMKAEFEEKRQVVMGIYRTWHHDTGNEGVVVSQQVLRDWLSKYCLERYSEGKKEDAQSGCQIVGRLIPNSDIQCPHGKLDPDKATEMKVISKDAYKSIVRESHCRFEPLLRVCDTCDDCIISNFQERLYEIEHPRLVKEFETVQEVDEDSANEGYWISKVWLKDWKLQRPRMHKHCNEDPPPDAPGFAEHVVCDHGGLLPNATSRKKISSEAKTILQRLFPEWDPLSTNAEVCVTCQASISMSKEDKRELRRKAEDEKAKLKHMNNMAFRYFTMPSTEDSCAIIPTRFYTSWKRWIDSPASHDRPDCIDTESLLCAHSMLLYDPGCRVDMDSIITLIRRDEWEILSSFYSTGPPIYVKRTASDNSESSFSELNPGICAECRTLRKINWETTELTIQLGKREDWESSKALGPSASLPVRHSRRLRKKQGDKRKISVTKSTTVKDIKIQISEIFDIPTICQRLFFQGKELADNESTVHDLAIPANDTVFLEQITEAMEIDSDDDSTTRRRVREEGQGFNGTILGGGSFTDSSRASSRAETPTSVLVSSVKSCKACTFDNALGALACEICTTVFE